MYDMLVWDAQVARMLWKRAKLLKTRKTRGDRWRRSHGPSVKEFRTRSLNLIMCLCAPAVCDPYHAPILANHHISWYLGYLVFYWGSASWDLTRQVATSDPTESKHVSQKCKYQQKEPDRGVWMWYCKPNAINLLIGYTNGHVHFWQDNEHILQQSRGRVDHLKNLKMTYVHFKVWFRYSDFW